MNPKQDTQGGKVCEKSGAGIVLGIAGSGRRRGNSATLLAQVLDELVTEDMIAVEGITETKTLIAFRQYSEHDLENMFGLGLE